MDITTTYIICIVLSIMIVFCTGIYIVLEKYFGNTTDPAIIFAFTVVLFLIFSSCFVGLALTPNVAVVAPSGDDHKVSVCIDDQKFVPDENPCMDLPLSFHEKKDKLSPNKDTRCQTVSLNGDIFKDTLKELDELIGMEAVKDSVYEQLAYAIMLNQRQKQNKYMLHTVLTGPPGVGKTKLAYILAKLWSSLGIIGNNPINMKHWPCINRCTNMRDYIKQLINSKVPLSTDTKVTFVKATRADLIAGYIGQTAIKTKEIIKSALGGVLFVDEAYELAKPSGIDDYGSECLTLLNEMMSLHAGNLIVIFAGYEDCLDNSVFLLQPGLKRRFTWKFNIEGYNSGQLAQIFMQKVEEDKWIMEPSITLHWLANFIQQHLAAFPHYGGDVEKLLYYAILSYSTQKLTDTHTQDNVLTKSMIYNAIIKLKQSNKISNYNSKVTLDNMVKNMYQDDELFSKSKYSRRERKMFREASS